MDIPKARRFRNAFTLIELLVVIAILAILAVVVVLTLNPAELLRQSRDANRLSDMDTLVHAIGLYQEDVNGATMGTSSTTYLSVADAQASTTAGDACQALGMPTSTTWHCASSTYYRNVTGTGWLPLNFASTTTGSPLGSLPVDPVNQTSSNLFYSYESNGNQYELTTNLESQKYQSSEQNDGGQYADLFERGTSLALASTDYTNPGLSSGSVAQTNMRLSTVTGTAYVDFGVAGSLTSYIGDKITILDSAGHQLVGWIKAAGTGETYGSQLLPNSSLTTTSNLNTNSVTLSTIGSGGQSGGAYLQVTLTGAFGGGIQAFNASSGMLLKSTAYLEKGTETSGMWVCLGTSGWVSVNCGNEVLPSTWTQYGEYGTVNLGATSFVQEYNGVTSGKTALFDTASVTQVLTPSVTGVTIVSASGGSTQNWTSQDPSFNLNDSGGYTYSITHS